jgi:endoglucanase
MNRREFLWSAGVAVAAGAVGAGSAHAAAPATRPSTGPALPEPSAAKPPRWRGFNLLEKFVVGQNHPYRESDFEWMASWGFNFARLPMSYLCWTDPARPMEYKEEVLRHIDQAVEYGRRYNVHVNLNLHRAPGYCVNPPKEPLSLWDDEKALEQASAQWAMFARRFKGVASANLSFDLLNEPPDVPEEKYARVARRLVEAIRKHDPKRLIVADGRKWGTEPVHSLADLSVMQSTRGYRPVQISHWKANWMVGSDKWAEPTWPLRLEKDQWDRQRLARECIAPWKAIEAKGVGVHVGEWGAFHHTPHKVVLAWMKDYLELWKDAGWGWALWNLRGSFGVVDSGRKDVKYDSFKGRKLDRAMLELLRAH